MFFRTETKVWEWINGWRHRWRGGQTCNKFHRRRRTDGGEEKRRNNVGKYERMLRKSRTTVLCFGWGMAVGGGDWRESSSFTSWRIDCHYDYQLPHGDTMVTGQRLEIWLANPAGWDEILRLSEDQGKLCWGRGVNWSVTPFPIWMTCGTNENHRHHNPPPTLTPLTPLLCINLCLEVTASENSIWSVSSHQYLCHSPAPKWLLGFIWAWLTCILAPVSQGSVKHIIFSASLIFSIQTAGDTEAPLLHTNCEAFTSESESSFREAPTISHSPARNKIVIVGRRASESSVERNRRGSKHADEIWLFGDKTSTRQYEPQLLLIRHPVLFFFFWLLSGPLPSYIPAAVHCQVFFFFFSIKGAKYSSCFPFEGYLTFPLMHLSALMFPSLLCSGIFYIPVREKMSTKYKMLLSCCLAALRKNLYLLSREAGPGVKYLFRRKHAQYYFFF